MGPFASAKWRGDDPPSSEAAAALVSFGVAIAEPAAAVHGDGTPADALALLCNSSTPPPTSLMPMTPKNWRPMMNLSFDGAANPAG